MNDTTITEKHEFGTQVRLRANHETDGYICDTMGTDGKIGISLHDGGFEDDATAELWEVVLIGNSADNPVIYP